MELSADLKTEGNLVFFRGFFRRFNMQKKSKLSIVGHPKSLPGFSKSLRG